MSAKKCPNCQERRIACTDTDVSTIKLVPSRDQTERLLWEAIIEFVKLDVLRKDVIDTDIDSIDIDFEFKTLEDITSDVYDVYDSNN